MKKKEIGSHETNIYLLRAIVSRLLVGLKEDMVLANRSTYPDAAHSDVQRFFCLILEGVVSATPERVACAPIRPRFFAVDRRYSTWAGFHRQDNHEVNARFALANYAVAREKLRDSIRGCAQKETLETELDLRALTQVYEHCGLAIDKHPKAFPRLRHHYLKIMKRRGGNLGA